MATYIKDQAYGSASIIHHASSLAFLHPASLHHCISVSLLKKRAVQKHCPIIKTTELKK